MGFVKSAEFTPTPLRPKGPPPRNPFRPRNVLIAGLALITASLLAGCNITNDKKGNNTPAPDTSVESPSHKGGDPIWGDDSDSKTTTSVPNYVDNKNGVQIFGTAAFGSVTNAKDSHAQYGVQLNVTCYVTNDTGSYGSVNALYRIKGGKWDGDWVPANVMLNSGTAQLGDRNTPDLDPRVPACK